MFLQRVQNARLIIGCKLGLTSLHDFVKFSLYLFEILKSSHDSKECRFSCLRSNFALTSISLSGRPFLYDTMSGSLKISLRSGFCCVMPVAHKDFFRVLKFWMVLCVYCDLNRFLCWRFSTATAY